MAYDDDEAARRRACPLHRGTVNGYCYPCNERERAIMSDDDDAPCICGAYEHENGACLQGEGL